MMNTSLNLMLNLNHFYLHSFKILIFICNSVKSKKCLNQFYYHEINILISSKDKKMNNSDSIAFIHFNEVKLL